MKRTALLTAATVIMLIILSACGGVQTVNTNINVPELDRTQFNDTAYTEGWALLKAGDPGEAIKRFQQSNVVDEKLYVGFGYAFLAQNKLTLARRNFDKALELNAHNLQAHFGIASIHELLKENEDAFRIYAKLRTRHTDNAWIDSRYEHIKTSETKIALADARRFKLENQTLPYLEALKRAASYSPEMTDIKHEIADYHYARGQYDEAVQHYEALLDTLKDNVDIMEKLAECYEESRKLDRAVVIYKRLLAMKPGTIRYMNKVNDLKIRFYELNMPEKFKNIFFKQRVNREDLAALLGHYFEKYLETRSPVIITDIANSFAMEHIIKICTLKIMSLRPDHSFDRFRALNRTSFAVVLNALTEYLEKLEDYVLRFTPPEQVQEPSDISPRHKYYTIIKFMANAQLIKLDDQNRFNPTAEVSPAEVLTATRKILNSIEEKEEVER